MRYSEIPIPLKRVIKIKKGKMFCLHDWQEKKGFMRLRYSSREWAHFKCSKCPAEKWHEVIGLGTWMSLTGL